MRITEKELKKNLIELYVSTFQEARNEVRNSDKFKEGKAAGENEAAGAVCLLVFGGMEYMKIWEICIRHEETDDWKEIAAEVEKAILREGEE